MREKVVQAIPPFLKSAIGVGIGFFIAFIGLQIGGVIVDNPATLVGIGSFKEEKALLTLSGLVLCLFLYLKRVKGAFLICIFAVTLMGIPFGLTKVPEHFSLLSLPSKPLFFDFAWDRIFSLDFFVVFFTFFFIDLFDTVGMLIAIASQAGLINEDGSVVQAKQAFFADAVGTTIGAVLGTSTISTYAESAAGVVVGGRTGITTLVTAGLFLLSLFFAPVFLLVPAFATAPVLIMVGFLMSSPLKNIDFCDCSEGIPTFLTILLMPLAYSIAEGIVFGILSFVLCALAQKNTRMVSPLTWGLAVIFMIWLIIR